MSYQCCSPGYSGNNSYSSGLEQRIGQSTMYFSAQDTPVSHSYAKEQSQQSADHRSFSIYSIIEPVQRYAMKSYETQPQIHFTPEYAFSPDAFLRPNRAPQPFVGDAAQVESDVKDAFFATLGVMFPTDIRIFVLTDKEFDKQVAERSVVGFSLNRREFGLVSDVVVRSGARDHVLLTIGHEIGHVLTKTLSHKHNEEAKAFAFNRAWMNAIRSENIAGLKHAIVLDNPAHNGLHDVACSFVWRMIKAGRGALDVHWELVHGLMEVQHELD